MLILRPSTDHRKVNIPVRDGTFFPRDGIPVSRDEKSFGRGNLSRGTVISRDENLVAWEGKRVAWEIIIYM
jgi:hypothetical protein